MKHHHKSMLKLISKYVRRPASGAEIGVYLGATAAIIHSVWPQCKLLLVDPWAETDPDDTYRIGGGKMGRFAQSDWDEVYTTAMHNIACSPGPSVVWRMTSATAAAKAEDDSLDFVFIDADHTYEGTRQDIQLWLPKCRGLIMGHDYDGKGDRAGVWGVKQAVDQAFGVENVYRRRGHIWAYLLPRRWRPRRAAIKTALARLSEPMEAVVQ